MQHFLSCAKQRIVGNQTKRPSWFLHRMVRYRPPSACVQGAQKELQATNRALRHHYFSYTPPKGSCLIIRVTTEQRVLVRQSKGTIPKLMNQKI
jgi:hypothetical protein